MLTRGDIDELLTLTGSRPVCVCVSVCLSVCVSVTALAASASVYTRKQLYTRASLGFSWFRLVDFQNLPFKSYSVKSK